LDQEPPAHEIIGKEVPPGLLPLRGTGEMARNVLYVISFFCGISEEKSCPLYLFITRISDEILSNFASKTFFETIFENSKASF
jgi:hypothetical protein